MEIRITEAANGLEALELVKTNSYHAILSDINMPKLNGLEFLQQIRNLNIHTPFILLTAYGDKEKAIAALRLGAFDFIDKPWSEEYLLHTIGRAIEVGVALKSMENFSDVKQGLLEVIAESNQSSLEFLVSQKGKHHEEG